MSLPGQEGGSIPCVASSGRPGSHGASAPARLADPAPRPRRREAARLAAVGTYAAVGWDVRELRSLTDFALNRFGTATAAITLVEQDGLRFVAHSGVPVPDTLPGPSLCSHAVLGDSVLVVPDTSRHPRFRGHPCVTGPLGIRFYAGAPLVSPLAGHRIGSFCLLDRTPRPSLDRAQRLLLADLAGLAMDQIERARQKATHQIDRFDSMSHAAPNAIICTNESGLITTWNRSAERLLGWSARETLGQPLQVIIPERLRDAHKAGLARLAGSGGRGFDGRVVQLPALRRDGAEIQVEMTLSCWREGTRLVLCASLRDITSRQLGEERLRFAARHDTMTGLPNRASFLEMAGQARERGAATIAVLDLDGLKHVNDRHGLRAGDAVLREAGRRIAAAAGRSAVAGCLGGDEFAVLWGEPEDCPDAGAAMGAILSALSEPFLAEGQLLHLSACAGMARAGAAGATILGDAHLALQDAKRSGPGGLRVFDASLRDRYEAGRHLAVELRDAVAADQFELFYQPQVRLSDAALVGVEALLRWRHPSRGLLAPAAFLEVLNADPLAAELGHALIDRACRQAAEWRTAGQTLRVAVNLFAEQLLDGRLPEVVSAALDRWTLSPSQLELEITETIVLAHDQALLATLGALRARGVGIAFDDFGTGFASLSTLKRLPLTRLKIDRGFVSGVGSSQHDTAIVKAVLTLARELGMTVVAEGIETQAQASFLRAHGCEEGQGYLFGRPARACDVVVLDSRAA